MKPIFLCDFDFLCIIISRWSKWVLGSRLGGISSCVHYFSLIMFLSWVFFSLTRFPSLEYLLSLEAIDYITFSTPSFKDFDDSPHFVLSFLVYLS